MTGAHDGMIGRVLGGFAVKERIAEGGYGEIYRAEQTGLGREAVIKVQRRSEAEGAQRFLREVRLAARLDHPYAAHIYAFGAEDDGVLWIAMELVRGTSLADVLRRQRLSLERFAPLLDRICEVVHTAHEQGIVHRDLKPHNVMVVPRAGRLLPKLLDFGIAKISGDGEPSAGPGEGSGDDPALTGHGARMGSPFYMAPEQWTDAGAADARADVYALGVLCYETLAGRVPFRGDMAAVARGHAREPVPPLGDGFPAALDGVLRKAMAKQPGERFASALDLASAFRAAAGLADEPEALPALDDELARELAYAPAPILDSMAALAAARNLHEARDALRDLVHVTVHYLGVLALACRTLTGTGTGPVPGGDDEDAPAVLEAVRALHNRDLEDGEWLELARGLTAPFARLRDAHPIPELVALFQGGKGPFERALAAFAEGAGDLRAQLTAALPPVAEALRAVAFLCDYQLVVPAEGGGAAVWMGATRPMMTLTGEVPAGRPLLVDLVGRPLVALWPLAQVARPAPGEAPTLFLLEGKGRHGARLRAYPRAFERHDEELWEWLRARLPDPRDAAGGPVAVEETPYRGLSAFTRGDSALFFGRERQSQELVNRLLVQPLVAVVGPSGAGKSSFVQAGVLPLLPEAWRVAVIRPGASPAAALAAAPATLDLLVIDQLEELFTLSGDGAERERFVAAALARAPRLVVTLRDDFLARAAELPALADRLGAAVMLLGTPAAAQLVRILCEPARRAGYELDDPGLAARMVDEVAGRPGALALLSFTATRLWELRDRHFKQLTRRAYEAMGGVGGALAQHAELTLAAMAAEDQPRVRDLFRRLVTAEGTRALASREELGGERAAAVIERLVAARLLVASEAEDGAERIEIVHEALLSAWPRLVGWRREDAEGARLRDQLTAAARQWVDRGRAQGLLWRGDALAEYRAWRGRYPGALAPAEEAFAQASVRAAARSRRVRVGLGSAAFVLLAAALTVTLALNRVAHGRLVDSHREQARQAWLAGDAPRALLYLNEAVQEGAGDPALRYLVARATRRLGALKATLAHDAPVTYAGWSGDGALILTTDRDGGARLWNGDGTPRVALAGHADRILTGGFSPDGELAFTAGADGAVRLWRTSDGSLVRALAHEKHVLDAAFSPDGARLATASHDRHARVWDVASGAPLLVLGGEVPVTRVAWSRDGARLATARRDGTVEVWDARGGALLATLRAHDAGLVSLDFGRDGRLLTAGDRSARLWDPGGAPLVTVEHLLPVSHAELSGDDRALVTAGDDDTVRVWDAAGGRPRLLLPVRAGATAAAFSPDGAWLATGSRDGVARLWDARRGTVLGTFVGHKDAVDSARFDGAGRTLLTASGDGTARLWDLGAMDVVATLETGRAWFAAWSPDGATLATVGEDRRVRLWREGGALAATLPAAAGEVNTAQWSRDGRLLVYAGDEVALVDATSGAARLHVPGAARYAELSPDGRRLVVAGQDGAVWIHDAAGGARLFSLAEDAAMASFSHDGGRLLTAGKDGAARIFDAGRQGPPLAVLRGGSAELATALFSRDDRRVVTAGNDGSAKVFAVGEGGGGRLLVTLEGHAALVESAELSPAGDLVLTASYDRTARIWDASTGALLDVLGGHAGAVTYATFRGDGELVATVSDDGSGHLWRTGLDHRDRQALAAFVACHVPFRLVGGTLLPRAPRCP